MRAGYSGTPLAKKLGIKDGNRVALVNAPDGFEEILESLPPGVELVRSESPAGADITVAFTTSGYELFETVTRSCAELPPDGALWVAWPKKSSGVTTDITEDTVREAALPRGLVDNKVCAIDQTWSGLRLVVRREHRLTWPSEGG